MTDYPQSQALKSKKPRLHGIFYWSLVREFASTGLLVSAILLGIVVFTQLIRFLGESVSGLLAVEGVMAMLGFSALNYLPVLLSISLFLSVLLTLTRCYRDSEMVVWFSSGIGLTRWIRPVLGYALPVSVLIALLSLVLSPWAMSRADEYKRRLESRDDVAAATPGAFRESKHGIACSSWRRSTPRSGGSGISSCVLCRTAGMAPWWPRRVIRRPRPTATASW